MTANLAMPDKIESQGHTGNTPVPLCLHTQPNINNETGLTEYNPIQIIGWILIVIT